MWSVEIEQEIQRILLAVEPDFDSVSKGFFYRANPLFLTKVHFREALAYMLNKDIKPDARILDYGCGTAQFLLLLHQFGYRNLQGWDQNERWLIGGRQLFSEIAKVDDVSLTRKARECIYNIAGEADGAFDVITMFSLIYGHNIDVPQALASVRKALVPGGRFIANDGKHGFADMENWLAEANLILDRSIVVRNRSGIENNIYFCLRAT